MLTTTEFTTTDTTFDSPHGFLSHSDGGDLSGARDFAEIGRMVVNESDVCGDFIQRRPERGYDSESDAMDKEDKIQPRAEHPPGRDRNTAVPICRPSVR